MAKFRKSGPSVFFHGAIAAATATFVGHFPWFYTHNLLDESIPKACYPVHHPDQSQCLYPLFGSDPPSFAATLLLAIRNHLFSQNKYVVQETQIFWIDMFAWVICHGGSSIVLGGVPVGVMQA